MKASSRQDFKPTSSTRWTHVFLKAMKNHVPIESLDSEIPVSSILCLSELSFDVQFISTPKTDAEQFLDNTVDQACTPVSNFMIPTNHGNISKTMTYRIAPSQHGCGAVKRGPEHFWAQKHCWATVHVVSRSELWLGSGFLSLRCSQGSSRTVF